MLKLTQYDSGNPVLIRPESIAAITQLSAFSEQDTGQEEGTRTRIDGPNGMTWLVTESAEAIASMMPALNPAKEQE